MSFSLASLTAYTDQERLPLITKAVFSARTAALFTKQVGVKSAAALNLMDTDAALAAGTACGWTAAGTTTFSQRNVTVAPMKVQEALCPRSLEQYWMQSQLTAGSQYDGVPFEQAFAEQKALRIAEALENAIWSGSTLVTGLLTILNAASGSTVSGNTAAISGSITTTNVISIFDNIYTRIPQAILTNNDLVIFCGWDVFRTLIGALKANTGVMYNQVDLQGLADGDIIYPGTNVRVVAVPGLLGYNRLVCSYLGNFVYATDLLSDEENFSLWYSQDNDEVRFQAAFKVGVQVAYPDLVVDWKLA
jgi:Phage capsid family.